MLSNKTIAKNFLYLIYKNAGGNDSQSNLYKSLRYAWIRRLWALPLMFYV
ncbi:hypothetical protein HMPREF1988_00717 [Porphyromonas gingivalis F0185]|nr:hypothetical protein HMPREF1988_00717 [Porphyromonas gingivalis F0185]ERJ88480.1 hypothetical protein HMPREF1989_00236 [Porphyromonas gingivalis F0566]